MKEDKTSDSIRYIETVKEWEPGWRSSRETFKRNWNLKGIKTKKELKRKRIQIKKRLEWRTNMRTKEKYQKSYYMPPEVTYDWVKKESIEKAPIWCSVDLRDGNQALIDPMCLEDKLEFFKMLVDIGFKEIEVGFPASSDTEYNFIRALIEKNMIPEDVTIQVLTQAREHIIKKTFEAVKGAPHAIVHLYNSTSVEQREQVFKKDKEAIKKIASGRCRAFKEDGRRNGRQLYL